MGKKTTIAISATSALLGAGALLVAAVAITMPAGGVGGVILGSLLPELCIPSLSETITDIIRSRKNSFYKKGAGKVYNELVTCVKCRGDNEYFKKWIGNYNVVEKGKKNKTEFNPGLYFKLLALSEEPNEEQIKKNSLLTTRQKKKGAKRQAKNWVKYAFPKHLKNAQINYIKKSDDDTKRTIKDNLKKYNATEGEKNRIIVSDNDINEFLELSEKMLQLICDEATNNLSDDFLTVLTWIKNYNDGIVKELKVLKQGQEETNQRLYVLEQRDDIKETEILVSDYFKKQTMFETGEFLARHKEMKVLKQKILSENVVVVCGMGGTGKTTLVKKALSEKDKNGETLEKKINFYQKINSENSADIINEFHSKIDLSQDGEKVWDRINGEKEKQEVNPEHAKNTWKGECLNKIEKRACFFIDNLETISKEDVDKLIENHGNVKFVITTRRAEGLAESIKIELEAFNEKEALAFFELNYFGNRKAKLTGEQLKIFNEDINSWCNGNAQALYLVACLLKGNGGLKGYKENFDKIKNNQYQTTTNDKECSLAEKLAELLKLDSEILQDDGRLTNNEKIRKALGVLYLTGMNSIEISALQNFIEDDSNNVSERVINRLKGKGLINVVRNEMVYMHPIVVETLKLKDIDNLLTDEIKLFAYLILEDTKNSKIFGIDQMTEITIPKGIAKIFDGAFTGTKRFVDFGGRLFPVDEETKDDYKVEGRTLFSKTSEETNKLDIVNITADVKEIGKDAFWGASLKQINFTGNNLERIGSSAFAYSSIENLQIPEGVTDIGYDAFYKCNKLVNLTLPNSIMKIGPGIVNGCDNIQYFEFGGCLYLGNEENEFLYLRKIKEDCHQAFIDVNDKCRFIGDGAFASFVCPVEYVNLKSVEGIGCFAFEYSHLKNLEIPKSIRYIDSGAFAYATDLETVTFEEGTTLNKIESSVLEGCFSLKNITLPSSVEYIGERAFRNCDSLETIENLDGVIDVDDTAFSGCDKLLESWGVVNNQNV